VNFVGCLIYSHPNATDVIKKIISVRQPQRCFLLTLGVQEVNHFIYYQAISVATDTAEQCTKVKR
jgi:hypothetical protein